MTNPFDSNPFEESDEPSRGRGANPFAEPSQSSAQPTPDPFAESYAQPFEEPKRAYSPAPMPDYAPAEHAPAPAPAPTSEGTIHHFSLFKAVLSAFSVLIGLNAIGEAEVLWGIGFGLPGAWYFIKSLQQKANPTEPQKRHWFVIWLIAILLIIIGA